MNDPVTEAISGSRMELKEGEGKKKRVAENTKIEERKQTTKQMKNDTKYVLYINPSRVLWLYRIWTVVCVGFLGFFQTSVTDTVHTSASSKGIFGISKISHSFYLFLEI